MRHHIPTLLALTLVVSVSFLMGQLVVNKSQDVQAEYSSIEYGLATPQMK
ncbi:MAG: hypothetical protein ACEQSB_01605 [Undibacterium sp.]